MIEQPTTAFCMRKGDNRISGKGDCPIQHLFKHRKYAGAGEAAPLEHHQSGNTEKTILVHFRVNVLSSDRKEPFCQPSPWMTDTLDNTFLERWLFSGSSRQSLIPHFDKVASNFRRGYIYNSTCSWAIINTPSIKACQKDIFSTPKYGPKKPLL